MAHGRVGPDIVMTIRYVGASDIRAVTDHELKRTPDGTSAIDPKRSHLNRVLVGPRTQQEALNKLYDSGVMRPATQSEAPYVQIVMSASPEFFRTAGMVAGEWDPKILQEWEEQTLSWLKKEYGDDLIHVSLHLDEDTPHMHVLIAPTYRKTPRKPGRRKIGESELEFEARKEAKLNGETQRVVGRSSNLYWKRNFARRIARLSYHKYVEEMGLGYGTDFYAEGEPSPKHKITGAWVREKAAELKEKEAILESDRLKAEKEREEKEASLIQKLKQMEDDAKRDRENLAEMQLAQIKEAQNKLQEGQNKLTADQDLLEKAQNKLKEDLNSLRQRSLAVTKRERAVQEAKFDIAKKYGSLSNKWKALTGFASIVSKVAWDVGDLLGISMDKDFESSIVKLEAEAERIKKEFSGAGSVENKKDDEDNGLDPSLDF